VPVTINLGRLSVISAAQKPEKILDERPLGLRIAASETHNNLPVQLRWVGHDDQLCAPEQRMKIKESTPFCIVPVSQLTVYGSTKELAPRPTQDMQNLPKQRVILTVGEIPTPPPVTLKSQRMILDQNPVNEKVD
jgi:hypothetical protein